LVSPRVISLIERGRLKMTMAEGYLNAIATAGGALITHIGLVDAVGTELSGGDPAYARQAVTWTDAANGVVRPNADLTFDIPASTTVGGWRGFSALTGGTNYGGEDLTQEVYAAQGQYKLLAAGTGITHTSS
jgi:hypothetical protein